VEVNVVTTRRVRHGILLALAGLLAGLGIVAALFWDGGVGSPSPSAPQGTAPGPETPSTLADMPPASRPDAAAPAPKAAAGDRAERAQPPAPAPPKETDTSSPRFDLVRVEPNGEAVVAGRGKPNSVVEMLVDGQPVARALTDPTGQFAIVPPPLPRGASEIVLRSRSADGRETRSEQSIAVSISPKGDTQPLVALTSPDAPTVVLSQPGATAQAQPGAKTAEGGANSKAAETRAAETRAAGAAPAGAETGAKTGGPKTGGAKTAGAEAPGEPGSGAPALRIVSVDGEGSGRLFVTGIGSPGSEVRLYLNDTLITPAKVGPDGRVTFTIGRGMSAGRYRVRVEQVDPATGKVAHRAEVAFVMPEAVAGLADTRQADRPAGPTTARSTTSPEAAKPGSRTDQAAKALPPAATPAPAASTAAPTAAASGTGRMAGESQGSTRPGAVYVPEITTARITRGDNLWQISKRTYGHGQRYTVIFDANQDQIRDPDLIYPGQTFVLPSGRRG
jgi:nucleoid-associated protein YgaU